MSNAKNDEIRIDLSSFSFSKDTGVLTLPLSSQNLSRFPAKIHVYSHHTGRTVTFVQDHVSAAQNEFWDGELMQYVPLVHLPRVTCIVVYPY